MSRRSFGLTDLIVDTPRFALSTPNFKTQDLTTFLMHCEAAWESILNHGVEVQTSFCNFSPQMQFLVKFFPTQKCANRDKTYFAKKTA